MVNNFKIVGTNIKFNKIVVDKYDKKCYNYTV